MSVRVGRGGVGGGVDAIVDGDPGEDQVADDDEEEEGGEGGVAVEDEVGGLGV